MARRIRLAAGTLIALGVLLAAPMAGASPLGDCSSEPALAGRADVVFCEPWEAGDWWQHGFAANSKVKDPSPAREQHVGNTSIETAGCVSGRCLKVQMKQYQTTAVTLHWPLANADLQPQQLYMRYYLKLGPTWNNDSCIEKDGKPVYYGQGGKLPGLADIREDLEATGQCGFGGHAGDGINCWSHRAGFRNCGGRGGSNLCRSVDGGITRFLGYVYFPGQEGSTGSNALWDGDPWGQFTKGRGRCSVPANLYCATSNLGMLARERWYALEQFIKMNTPGRADGVIRGWVDGKLAYEKTNMVFRLPGHDNLHVRTAWLDVYKGGTYGNCNDSEIWLDQMVLATDAPIGPLGPRR